MGHLLHCLLWLTSACSPLCAQIKADVTSQLLDLVDASLTLTAGCIMSDGWSDITNRPIINVLLGCPKGCKMVCAVNTEGSPKTAEFIYELLFTEIEKIGAKKVVLVSARTLPCPTPCTMPCPAMVQPCSCLVFYCSLLMPPLCPAEHQ